jgi:hypothetical protein
MTQEWERAGIPDENGKISRPLDRSGLILVPPRIEIVSIKDEKGEEQFVINYPLTKDWYQRPINSNDFDLFYNFITNNGWREKDDIKGLMDDFVRLSESSNAEVERFVLKWGPMWNCSEHKSIFHCWDPGFQDSNCSWIPSERIIDFQKRARIAKLVLDISANILYDNPAPESLWEDLWNNLGYPGASYEKLISIQRPLFAGTINRFLSITNGPGIRLIINENDEAKLAIGTGLGFYKVIWVQLAQVVARGKGLYICDGCGNAYIREKKKPKKDNLNFCDKCGQKGAKKMYARRKRDSTN